SLLHREDGLAEAVAAKRAARQRVGVDGVAVDLLVRATIDGDALTHRVEKHAAAVVAIGSGIREHVHGDRGDTAVLPRPDLNPDPHRVTAGRTLELLTAGIFVVAGAARRRAHPRR